MPEAEIVAAPRESLAVVIATAEGFVGNPTPALVRRGGKLRWMQVHSSGVDDMLFPEIRDHPITLTNAKIVKGPQMADHAMALLLALTRQVDRAVAHKAQKKWNDLEYTPIELRGKTAVIIGSAHSGNSGYARRARVFVDETGGLCRQRGPRGHHSN